MLQRTADLLKGCTMNYRSEDSITFFISNLDLLQTWPHKNSPPHIWPHVVVSLQCFKCHKTVYACTDTHAHRASHPLATWETTKERRQTKRTLYFFKESKTGVARTCICANNMTLIYLQCSRSKESSDFLQKRRNRVQSSLAAWNCVG